MWVAREENGLLRLYTKKPYRYVGGIWRIPNDGDCINVSEEEYPQYKSIKWEDEPIEVGIVPKKYIDLFIEENENEYEEYKKEVIQTDYQIRAEGLYG